MKKILFLVILFGISIQNQAQEFAPIGAEWYWEENFAFSGNIDFIKFRSEKDTLINDVLCKKITKRHKLICYDRPDIEYLFTRNDTVFFFDEKFNTFQILYDFNAQAKDSWTILLKDEYNDIDSLIITVDSTAIQQINDSDLKVLYVTYFKKDEFMPETYNSKIIERIGDVQYMFNWYPFSSIACDGNLSKGLRCYQGSQLGSFTTGIAESCDYTFIWTGIDEDQEEEGLISIFPNPTQGRITIESYDKTIFEVKITNLLGELIIQREFSEILNIDLSAYRKGIYLVSVFKNKNKIASKKIINNTCLKLGVDL